MILDGIALCRLALREPQGAAPDRHHPATIEQTMALCIYGVKCDGKLFITKPGAIINWATQFIVGVRSVGDKRRNKE